RLGRGVGRMADDDAVAHLAVLRVGHLVDVPERDRVAAQPVVLLEPAGHRPERAGDLAFRRQVHRGRRLAERALPGRQLEPVDQRTGGGKRAAPHHLRAREANGLAEPDEDLRVGLVAAGQPSRLLLVDALRELHALLGERTVGVHRAHGAGKLTHLQEELDSEDLQLFLAQLAVGQLEPEWMATEGPPGLDAGEQIPDEVLGCQNLAHCFLLHEVVPDRSQSDQGSLSQGRSSGVIPPPTGKNWRCAYISRAMPWLSSSRNARLRPWVKSMRVYRRTSGGRLASSRASSHARSRSRSLGSTSLTAPQSSASCAESFFPVRRKYRARLRPTIAGQTTCWPSPGTMPRGKCGRSWKYASSEASTMSLIRGTSEWMLHGPLTAVIIGTSTASTFSMSMRPYQPFSSSFWRPFWPSIARYRGFSTEGGPQLAL